MDKLNFTNLYLRPRFYSVVFPIYMLIIVPLIVVLLASFNLLSLKTTTFLFFFSQILFALMIVVCLFYDRRFAHVDLQIADDRLTLLKKAKQVKVIHLKELIKVEEVKSKVTIGTFHHVAANRKVDIYNLRFYYDEKKYLELTRYPLECAVAIDEKLRLLDKEVVNLRREG